MVAANYFGTIVFSRAFSPILVRHAAPNELKIFRHRRIGEYGDSSRHASLEEVGRLQDACACRVHTYHYDVCRFHGFINDQSSSRSPQEPCSGGRQRK